MSTKAIGRTVGFLILLAYVVYITGGALVESGSSGADILPDVVHHSQQIAAGALLMFSNSLIVASIGVLVFSILRPYNQTAARAYLVTRIIEGVTMAMGVLWLLVLVPLGQEYVAAVGGEESVLPALARVAKEANQYAYQMGMITLGVGSLVFCRALLRTQLVPRFMAVWGLVGYAIFLAGGILEVIGYPVSLALSVPGGLFEIAFAVLLIARGFPGASPTRHADNSGTRSTLPSRRDRSAAHTIA